MAKSYDPPNSPRRVPHSPPMISSRVDGRPAMPALALAVCGWLVLPNVHRRRRLPRAAGPHPYRPGIDVVDYSITLDLPDRGGVDRRARGARRSPMVAGRHARARSRVAAGRQRARGRASRSRSRERTRHSDSDLRRVVGDSFSVAVRYGGEPKDGLIIRTDSSGRWTAFGDNWPNRARNWIPSIDHPVGQGDRHVDRPSAERTPRRGERRSGRGDAAACARGLAATYAYPVARVASDLRPI